MTLRTIARRAATFGGFLSLGLLVLLASPGVRVARADDASEFERFLAFDRTAHAGAAPVLARAGEARRCEAGAGQAQRMAAAQALRELQLAAAARMAPGTAGVELENGAVMLNNRGYNYGPGPVVDPARLETELRLSR